MLQVAFGGHRAISDENIFINSPVYQEPGFTILFPLEISSAKAKNIYILLRIRSDSTGSNFEAGTADVGNRFTFSAKNATNGEILASSLTTNSTNSGWNTSSFNPYVWTIAGLKSILDTDFQVGSIDCFIKDTQNNSAITFRILISADPEPFSFLTVFNRKEQERPTSSTLGSSGIVRLSRHGSYTLLSPLTSFQESSDNIDFSYPRDVINYQQENAVNDEPFTFSIKTFTPDSVGSSVSLFPVPNFHKIAILRVDGKLHQQLASLKEVGSIDVEAVGKITGVKNAFRMNLVPSTTNVEVRSL